MCPPVLLLPCKPAIYLSVLPCAATGLGGRAVRVRRCRAVLLGGYAALLPRWAAVRLLASGVLSWLFRRPLHAPAGAAAPCWDAAGAVPALTLAVPFARAARGEAMNRLLDRLPGTPMYLLWGEKVRRAAVWWVGARHAARHLDRRGAAQPVRCFLSKRRLPRSVAPQRGGCQAPLGGTACTAPGDEEKGPSPWRPPHPLTAHPAGPLVRACQGHPDPALLPGR